MTVIDIEEITPVEDNIHVSVHDIEDLREEYPDWDSYSKKKKNFLSRTVSPIHEESTHNIVCIGLTEYIVDNLDSNQSVDESASHLAVGDDNTTPVTANTNLNNEVGRFSVTTTSDDGSTADFSTFLDTSEANGNSLREVGLVNQSSTSGDVLFNHSTISEIVKTNTKVATIDVRLSFAFEGSTTQISVSDDGTEVVSDISDLNFSGDLIATDDGDGTSSVDYNYVEYEDLRRVF